MPGGVAGAQLKAAPYADLWTASTRIAWSKTAKNSLLGCTRLTARRTHGEPLGCASPQAPGTRSAGTGRCLTPGNAPTTCNDPVLQHGHCKTSSLATRAMKARADTDLVLREMTAEMLLHGPGASGLVQVVEIEGCGHASALNVPDQLDRVAAFIDAAC